jgi:hypothetical protein
MLAPPRRPKHDPIAAVTEQSPQPKAEEKKDEPPLVGLIVRNKDGTVTSVPQSTIGFQVPHFILSLAEEIVFYFRTCIF